ncbi:MAG: hypothetical protein IPH84_01575 [Bacteroidales bacterium]|nr:hypothetical protein [Bacteroidales bacterium]
MTQFKHIGYRLLLVGILVMTMASAMAQVSVSAGQTYNLSVIAVPGDTYSWELYNEVDGINLANTPGNCPNSEAFFLNGVSTGPDVSVTWLIPGTYFYKVTASRAGCTMNLKVGKMTVLESLPTAVIAQPEPICTGDTSALNIQLTGEGPWSVTLFDGTTSQTYSDITSSPFIIPLNPSVTTSYQVLEVSDANGTNNVPTLPVELMVKPRPVSSHIYQY